MLRNLLTFLILIGLNSGILAQKSSPPELNDGPYIFRNEKKTTVKWISNGYIRNKILTPETFNEIKQEFNLTFSYRDINQTFNLRPETRFTFRGVDSLAVISDIHGEFEQYIRLLKSQGIIDKDGNWSFGKGHLLILGDCFDRGDKVTELLWHIFGLEKQAEKAGGMVHMLLGNHEVMVLGEDLRYTNPKYLKVEKLTGMKYQDFYSVESLIGFWLRNKPVIITVNDIVFVHGGISAELVRKKLPIEEINHLFYQMQVPGEVESQNDLKNLDFLNDDHGPVWYRGYFDDPEFTMQKADSILQYFGKEHIIVGHTPSDDFKILFGKKIIGIDAGLGNNNEGAVLIIKKERYFKGTVEGRRIEF